MNKLYRRNQILDLLRHAVVATQEDLCENLAQRGIHVTQATVSRDIEELGLVKTREGYRAPEPAHAAPPPQPSLAVILKEFLQDVRLASNFVVVKTYPGNAHSVAVALDAERWPEVAGTVAGDDTIFVATPGVREASRIRRKLLNMVAD
jgi:transcriptional regulator of arginine metabolism